MQTTLPRLARADKQGDELGIGERVGAIGEEPFARCGLTRGGKSRHVRQFAGRAQVAPPHFVARLASNVRYVVSRTIRSGAAA